MGEHASDGEQIQMDFRTTHVSVVTAMRWGVSADSGNIVLFGPPPWGHRLTEDRTRLVANEGEQRVTMVARHMYAVQGLSVRRIVAELTAMGIVGRSGKPLTQTRVFEILQDGPRSKARPGRHARGS